MFTLNKTALALGLTFSLVGLTACGNQPATTDGESKPAKAKEASQESASSETKTDASNTELAAVQEVTLNNGADPESLDIHKVSGVPESNIIRQMLIGLTTTDPEGNTIPGMAESWESADNKTWTFKLRDANWSNGEPVKAEDFVYAWQRLVTPETASPYASYVADSKVANAQDIIDAKAKPDTLGIKAVDDKTLEVTLTEPVPYFPDVLIHTPMRPVHKATVEKFGDKWTTADNIVVNGPYKLTKWAVSDKIVLERNPEYYDNAKTTIDKITFLPISSETTGVTRYQAGEIDMTPLPSEQFEKLKKEIPEDVHVGPNLCTYYYEFNTAKAPFDDVRVRRALALSLNRNIITDKILKQGQTPAYQFTPPSTQGNVKNSPEWQSWDQAKRVEEAKKLLTEAGYSKDKPLKFELLYNTNESHKKIAVAAGQLWKQSFGEGVVEVELLNQEWKSFLDTRSNGKYQLSRAGWCGDYNEPSTFLNILKGGNSNNHGKYVSEEFDTLMENTLKGEVDTAKRIELYNQAEAQLDKDMPIIDIYHYVSAGLYKPYLLNFPKNDPLHNWQIKDVQVAKH